MIRIVSVTVLVAVTDAVTVTVAVCARDMWCIDNHLAYHDSACILLLTRIFHTECVRTTISL